ncbi:MAG: beta-ketoacyl-ACP synthase II, partial [Lentisphaeria bacterium]|nr:beta-ketoacyl-ACP synthase II [Lentisphaeria bacterium]
MQERRVVITGIGGVCCLGKNVETIWSDLIAGKCGIGPITLFDASGNKTR